MSIIGRSIRGGICRVFRSLNEKAFAEAIADLPYTKEDIRWLNEMYCNIYFIQDSGWVRTRAMFWRMVKDIVCALWYAKIHKNMDKAMEYAQSCEHLSKVSILSVRKFVVGVDREEIFTILTV